MQPKLELSNLLTPFIKVVTSVNDEMKNLLEFDLHRYLESQLAKFYHINTFLHRGEKIRLDDIYYPIKLKHKRLVTDFSDLKLVFDEYNFIAVIGYAGSGKSTLIKKIFLDSIRQNFQIPILVELRKLNNHQGNLLSLIHYYLLNNNVKPSQLILERVLNKGGFLFLFDGYDEIYSENKERINFEIEEFIDKYSRNKYIITSRPDSGVESFYRLNVFNVLSLEVNEIEGFAEKMIIDFERKKRFTETINKVRYVAYTSYLRNPLLLSMFILSFETHPEIPERKSSFYRNVFDTLYSRHDGINKSGYPREKLSKLQKHSFENLIMQFSCITFFKGEAEFTEEYLFEVIERIRLQSPKLNFDTELVIRDLNITLSLLIKDGLLYSYMHKSMQEYFSAYFISKLDTSKKELFYKNNLPDLHKKYNDWGHHFWTLLEELDSNNFNQFFVIPVMESFVNDIEKYKKGSLRFIEMVDQINIGMYLSDEDKGVLHFGIPLSNFFKITQFLNINEFMAINNYEWNKRDSKRVYKLSRKSIKTSDKAIALSEVLKIPELYSIFKKQGFIENFEEGYRKVESFIEVTKNMIEFEDRGIDDLIGDV